VPALSPIERIFKRLSQMYNFNAYAKRSAVALKHTDLTDFVIHHAVRAAKAVIEQADHVQLSDRDSLRVLDLLENPSAENARLLAAARALPKRR
jgi:uncharacterized protein (DUF1778 family)